MTAAAVTMPPPRIMSSRETGTVKFFDRRKRIGFIIPNKGSGEVFLHEDELKNAPLVRTGEQVEYTRVPMPPPLKPKATNIVVIGGKK